VRASPNYLTIKLIKFSEQETESFSAIFSLAEARLKQNWRVVATEAETADFFLLTEERLKNSLLPGVPPVQCLFYSDEDSGEGGDSLAGNHILTDHNGVPRMRSLMEVLNKVGESPAVSSISMPIASGAQTAAEVTPPAPAPVETSPPPAISAAPVATKVDTDTTAYTEPRPAVQSLLKLLLAARTEPVWISAGEIDLWIVPADGCYYSSASLAQLAAYCTAHADTLLLDVQISRVEQQRIVAKEKLRPQTLSNLIWYVAFKSSQGRLLKGHTPQDIVHLLRWPDLGVPECRNYVKLAAFMHSNALSLLDIAATTGTPLEALYNFYNACYLTGLIEKAETSQRHEKAIHVEQQELLKKISDRLKGQRNV
jgi:hypothetical protein